MLGRAQELGTVTPFTAEEGEPRGRRSWVRILALPPHRLHEAVAGSGGWDGEEIDSKGANTQAISNNCRS